MFVFLQSSLIVRFSLKCLLFICKFLLCLQQADLLLTYVTGNACVNTAACINVFRSSEAEGSIKGKFVPQ